VVLAVPHGWAEQVRSAVSHAAAVEPVLVPTALALMAAASGVPPLTDGDLLLVHELGAASDLAVVRVHADRPHEVLAQVHRPDLTPELFTAGQGWTALAAVCTQLLFGVGLRPRHVSALLAVGSAELSPRAGLEVGARLSVPVPALPDPAGAVLRGAVEWAWRGGQPPVVAVAPPVRRGLPRGALVAGVAVLVVAALVVVGYLLLRPGSPSAAAPEPSSAPQTPTTTATTTSTTTEASTAPSPPVGLSDAEAALVGGLSAHTGNGVDWQQCFSFPDEEKLAGVSAAVDCVTEDPLLSHNVAVLQFADDASYQLFFSAQRTYVTGDGDCAQGGGHVGDWSSDGVTRGPLVCYQRTDSAAPAAQYIWGDDTSHVVAYLVCAPDEGSRWWTAHQSVIAH
jgi:hypothetical protein